MAAVRGTKKAKVKATAPAPAEYRPATPPSFQGEAARLWQRILDDPDDLATRRILADQLLEQGDPLGEYIQLETQADEMGADDLRRAPLVERAKTLRRRNIVPWLHAVATLAPFARARQPQKPRFALHRGLVEELSPTHRMLDAVPLAATVAPIRRLAIDSAFAHGEDGWHGRLAVMPALSRIRSLEFTAEREESALEVLASPHLRRLERLVLTAPATPRLAEAIAGSEACAQLVELRLHNRQAGVGGIGADGAAALARLPCRVLALSGHGLGDGLHAIAAMPTLRELSIANDKLGPAGAALLAKAPALAQLRKLELVHCELGQKGLVALASSPVLGRLRALALHGSNGVNGKAMAAMLAGWALGGLTELRTHGPLRKEGAEAIAGSTALDGLERVELAGAGLKDDGAAALARWAPRGLVDVDLSDNGIGVDGMGALADGPLLARVRTLVLSRNKCGTEGGKALARATWLEHLASLSLYYNWMGVLGVRAILERMPEAEELFMGENNYGVEPLRAAAGGALPMLRKLELWGGTEEAALENWLGLDDTRRLRSLRLRVGVFSDRAAELMSRLPELEDLHFTFCTFNGRSLDILRERFAGVLGFWPADEAT